MFMFERQLRCIRIALVSVILASLMVMLGVQARNLFAHQSLAKRIEFFDRQREAIHLRERHQYLGGKTVLNAKEMIVNNRLMVDKLLEINHNGNHDDISEDDLTIPLDSDSNVHGKIEVFEKLKARSVFKFLQRMPKGAVLHAKDFAMCSNQCLLELTYYDDSLWICVNAARGKKPEYEAFRFSHGIPTTDDKFDSECNWILLSELRSRENSSHVNRKLLEHFTLHATADNNLYDDMKSYEKLIHGLITYEPIWPIYIRKSMELFQNDNVQYVEIFSTLPLLYNGDLKNFTYLDTARLMREAVNIFSHGNQEFIGAMLVFEPSNESNNTEYSQWLEKALQLKRLFPNFFAGINLASNTNNISPLYYLTRKLVATQNEFDYFYHIDGIRNPVIALNDQNVMDSALLGSRRLSYDTALLRHPELLHLVRHQRIGIELSPSMLYTSTSYHISELNDHPSTFMFATNYPVVLTSEVHGFRNTTPLTHEFYLTFLGVASQSANLGTLKQLALNSLQASSTRTARKRNLIRTWSKLWDQWINEIVDYE